MRKHRPTGHIARRVYTGKVRAHKVIDHDFPSLTYGKACLVCPEILGVRDATYTY